jgi:hypothetical protein
MGRADEEEFGVKMIGTEEARPLSSIRDTGDSRKHWMLYPSIEPEGKQCLYEA